MKDLLDYYLNISNSSPESRNNSLDRLLLLHWEDERERIEREREREREESCDKE